MLKTHKLFQLLKELLLLGPKPLPALAELEVLFLLRWFKLTSEINPVLKLFRQVELKIPTLYVMGAEDYMFLESIKILTKEHRNSKLLVIPNCGHVVNVEKPNFFNNKSISFLKSLKK